MDQIPEYYLLLNLSRRQSEFQISREEFCQQRSQLLNLVDAKYNHKHFLIGGVVLKVKNKIISFVDKIKYKK